MPTFRVGRAIEKHHYLYRKISERKKISDLCNKTRFFYTTLAFLSLNSGSVIGASNLPVIGASTKPVTIFITLFFHCI